MFANIIWNWEYINKHSVESVISMKILGKMINTLLFFMHDPNQVLRSCGIKFDSKSINIFSTKF